MKKKLYIEGMSCGHCSSKVNNELSEVCGVSEVDVNLEEKSATLTLAHDVENNKFEQLISQLGYNLVKIEEVE